MLIKLHGNIALMLSSEQQLPDSEEYFVVSLSSVSFLNSNEMAIADVSPPYSLVEVFRFDEMMHNIASPDRKVMVCTGIDPHHQSGISFLMACHLIMSGSLGFEEAFLAFQPLHKLISEYFGKASFKNSLRAICCARCLGWIDFRRDEELENCNLCSIKMYEHVHYSRYA